MKYSKFLLIVCVVLCTKHIYAQSANGGNYVTASVDEPYGLDSRTTMTYFDGFFLKIFNYNRHNY